MFDEKKLESAVDELMDNEFWAEYYGNAPSGAKEYIALEAYSSGEDFESDEEFASLFKEVKESLEEEDKVYIAENSPNQIERSVFKKMLNVNGESSDGKDGGETGNAVEKSETSPTGQTGETGNKEQ